MKKSKFLFFFILSPLLNWAQTDLKRDNIFLQSNIFKDSIQQSDSVRFMILPVVTSLQNVGHHPTNWNNGSMIPAKGAQQYLRGGLIAKWKSFELQLAPEVIIAKNPYFETLSTDMDNVLWRSYYNFYNSIELPVQMGENPYQIIRLGQSFLSYRHKKISFAISNENKWWGPTERNALLLSTSAAGFPHISINSNQPIQTKYGNLDFEVLYGYLINGGWAPPESYKTLLGNPLYYPKPNQTRQIIGSNITIHPNWFKNLSLGFAQTYVQYTNDMHQFQNWLPIKSPFVPVMKDNPNKPILLSTFNFSYKLPKAAAEIYGEWGWNLSQTTFRNWFLQPDHGFASTFGLKKVFHTNKKYDWDILAEMTQLQLLTRADQFTSSVPPSWYMSSNIRQGYTNDGKLLGAGVGPGGSSQFFEINRRNKQNRIGLAFERRVHNNDLYQYMFVGSQDFRRFYVDFSTTLKIDWKIGNWQIGPRIAYVNTNNYYWWLYQTSDYYFITGRDLKQITTQLNLIYHF
jgi:hypothetical protein